MGEELNEMFGEGEDRPVMVLVAVGRKMRIINTLQMHCWFKTRDIITILRQYFVFCELRMSTKYISPNM